MKHIGNLMIAAIPAAFFGFLFHSLGLKDGLIFTGLLLLMAAWIVIAAWRTTK